MPLHKIAIDAGHGGPDPGASYAGIAEKNITRDLASRIGRRLAARGVEIVELRPGDENVSLNMRAIKANVERVAFVLSVHVNAAETPAARGFEVWTSPGDTPADAIATAIWAALRRARPGVPARADYDDGDPDKEANFYILRYTAAPAVLVEIGFLSNAEDRAWMLVPENLELLAVAIVSALVEAGPAPI